MPADSPKLFARHGWAEIGDVVRAHRDTIRRWMLDYGADDLRRRRRVFLEEHYASIGQKVPGRLPAVKVVPAGVGCRETPNR